MAAPSIVGTPTTNGRTTAGAFTITLPSGSPAGYIAIAAFQGASTAVTPGTGWTQLSQGRNTNNGTDPDWTQWVIWTATSAGTSWSTTASNGTAVVVVGYDGVLTAGVTTTLAGSAGAIPTSPTVTTTEASLALRVLVGNVFGSAETITYPAAATLGQAYAEQPNATGDRFIAAVAHEDRPSAGATGTATWTIGAATGYWLTAHTIILTSGPPPASPTFVDASALQAEASTTALGPVVIPAGATTDDIMVLGVMLNAAGTFSTPSGWTALGTSINSANQSTAWFWKRHTGSETNPSTTTSVTMSTTIGGYGRIYVFRGAINTGNPFEGVANAGTPTTSTTPTTSAVTTTGADRLVASIVMVDDDPTWSSGMPPSGWTNVGGRLSSTTGGDGMIDAISRVQATAGTVSAATVGTQSAAAYWRTLSFALIPASTAVTRTASDTLTLSGTTSAPVTVLTRTAAGTLTLSGTSAGLPALTRTSAGSLTLSGTAAGGPLVSRTATGALALSGAATGNPIASRTATGSLTLSGTAAGIASLDRTAAGSLALSGAAAGNPLLSRTATGALTVGGSAVGGPLFTRTAAGSVVVSGSATGTAVLTRTAAATLTIGGLAETSGLATRTAEGVLSLSGTAAAIVSYTRTAVGSLTLSGGAVGTVRLSRTSSGALALSGTASAFARLTVDAAGSLTLDGEAEGFARVYTTASGSLELAGEAEAVVRLVRTALATLDLSGVAEGAILDFIMGYVDGVVRPVTVTLMIDGVEHPVELFVHP